MTLREYLQGCRIGRGKLLIATDSDENFGIDNLNAGKYWSSLGGNWDLRRAEKLDAFSDCSEELVEALLDADVIEVDAHVDNAEQKSFCDGEKDPSSNWGYVCLIVDSREGLSDLEEEYFEEHGLEEEHFFMIRGK